MEIAGDLESLVCPLFRHGVRELSEDLLALRQFDMSLLKSLRPEKHLPSENQRCEERGYCIFGSYSLNEDSKRKSKDAKSQIANEEVADISDR